MAIYVNGKEITQIYTHNKVITAIYAGALLVWEAVKSCFGSGMWIPAKPWVRKEGWRRNKRN